MTEAVDKSGLWIKTNDNPYNDTSQLFDALYYQDTRITLLDDGAVDQLDKVAPHLIEWNLGE